MNRGIRLVAVVVALALGLAGSAGAAGATYTVNTTVDTVDANGCTPANPVCSLRDAVIAADQASTASTISVSPGTYALTIPSAGLNDPATGDLDITTSHPVRITSVGSGPTTIDAQQQSDRAFAVALGAPLRLNGVTITHGNPSVKSSGAGQGGAIFNNGALTVTNSTFNANTATSNGGAIDNAGAGALIVEDSTFTGNTTGGFGGAIADSGSIYAQINHDVFANNQAVGTGANGGGAIYTATTGTSTFSHDEFDGNSTSGAGGAINNQTTSITSDGSSFIGNSATGKGGGIFDIAPSPGGLSLTNATLSGNQAVNGGAIDFGGALAPVDLVNDTLTGNTGSSAGGGVADAGNVAKGSVGVVNTIVAGNIGGDCQQKPAAIDAGHNLDGDGSCFAVAAGDLPPADPKLGPPAGNGGPVQTRAELAGSPAIDAGANPSCPATDARGVSRPQNGTCDLGAYESFPPPAATTTTVSSTTTVAGPATTTTVTTGTPPPPAPTGSRPSATTRGVLGVTGTTGFLGGIVDPHGQATSYSFQVGRTPSYGLGTVTGHTDVGPLTIETRIAGLTPSTLYHYRLVATNAAGTSDGADRTFRTGPAYDGALKLDASKLPVRGGKVLVPLTCASTEPCQLRFSITIPARLARTHKLGTLSFTRASNTLVTLRAHRTTTVAAAVNPAALALLHKARGQRLSGKLSARPRTNQLGIISAVTLALG